MAPPAAPAHAARAPEAIVVGAGPVGLVAALHLARAGVRVLLLEKRPALSAASLASTIHPPTLEVLDRLGVLSRVSGQGRVADRIQYRTADAVLAEFRMGDLAAETRFPFRLHLEQARITPVLLDLLRAVPHAAVRFNAEVLAVDDAENGGVAVTLRGPDGAEVITAPFLLAADGARSPVRAALGIGFEGVTYPDKVVRVMTAESLEPLLPGIAPVTYLYGGGQSVSFLHMPDCWRIILRVPADVPEARATEESWIAERFRTVLPSCARFPAVRGTDVYGAARRVATRFGRPGAGNGARDGAQDGARGGAYLMGDAAHVTSTRGGMNMNCGIYDAVAMAGAVAAALRSGNGALVAAAAAERHRVATAMLLPRTDRTVSGGAAWAEHLAETARSPDAAAAYLRTASMLDMAPADA